MRPLDAAGPAEPEELEVLEPEEDFEQFLLPVIHEMREDLAALAREQGRAPPRRRGKLRAPDGSRLRLQARVDAAERSALNRLPGAGGGAGAGAGARGTARMAEMLVQLARRIERSASA